MSNENVKNIHLIICYYSKNKANSKFILACMCQGQPAQKPV